MKIKCLLIAATLFVYPLSANTSDHTTIERRIAVDVGSGSTKVTIADVDPIDQKIVTIIFEDSFSVPYQASLESSYDGSFDARIRDLGLNTFRHIKELAETYSVQKITAVATAAFRNAANGDAFAQEVSDETGIPLKIIAQKEEGTLAFFSGIEASEGNSDNLIVWDIGTGSFQMTTLTESNDLAVFMGETGSVPFKHYIIDLIQGKDSDEVSTPNPMTQEEVQQADAYARALGRKAYPLIKDKVKQPDTKLIGIGRLFSNSIGPIGEGGVIVRKDLRTFIQESIGLTDQELNNPYASVDVSNAILVLAFMKALHIQEIHIMDTKSTRGMLVYPAYWE